MKPILHIVTYAEDKKGEKTHTTSMNWARQLTIKRISVIYVRDFQRSIKKNQISIDYYLHLHTKTDVELKFGNLLLGFMISDVIFQIVYKFSSWTGRQKYKQTEHLCCHPTSVGQKEVISLTSPFGYDSVVSIALADHLNV